MGWWRAGGAGQCGSAENWLCLGFGFVFGFAECLRKPLLEKRLERFCALRRGVFGGKLALFGFALSRETRCPIGCKSFLYMLLCTFDFSGNWLCFFK